jgi:hypothetical protein
MGALDIPEILATIFEEVCSDSEFDAYRDQCHEPRPPIHNASKAHHPKPFLGPLRQVCKKWSRVISRTPNLQVIKILIRDAIRCGSDELWQGKLSFARELLEDPLESDIDFQVYIKFQFEEHEFRDVIQLIKSHILPRSHRIRKYEVAGIDGRRVQAFMEPFQDECWPRLRVLALMAIGDPEGAPKLFTINAPRLTYASFRGIRWSHQPFLPVSHLKTFIIYDLAWDPEASFLHLATYIPPLSFGTLMELVIDIRVHSLDMSHNLELGVVRIPRLLKLVIALKLPRDVWRLFMCIESPALEEVCLTSDEHHCGLGGIPTEVGSLDKDLPHLSKLSIKMPACWFLPILALCRRQISTITMIVLMEAEHASHVKLRSTLPSPIVFGNLKNLDFSLTYGAGECGHDEDAAQSNCQWFMSTFDFTSVANHARLGFNRFSGMRAHLIKGLPTFPHTKMISFSDLSDRGAAVLPELRHLTCRRAWDLDRQHCLEDWNHCRHQASYTNLQLPTVPTSIFTPFHKVQVLIITMPYYGNVFAGTFFNWMNTKDADGKLYLPELKTLHLIFQNYRWIQKELVLCQFPRVHEFLTERCEQGSPLHTLQLTGVTPFLLRCLEAENSWMSEINVEVVENSDDFASDLVSFSSPQYIEVSRS